MEVREYLLQSWNKKRLFAFAICFLVLLEAVFFVWFYSPKPLNHTFEGISYQLGTNQNVKPEIIHIEGTLQRNWNGARTFSGIIEIEDEELPIPNHEITIKFETEGRGSMRYSGFSEGKLYSHSYGSLYIEKDFSSFTIAKYIHEKDFRRSSWSGKDGLMISAPASNRAEALTLSNELMENYLRNPLR